MSKYRHVFLFFWFVPMNAKYKITACVYLTTAWYQLLSRVSLLVLTVDQSRSVSQTRSLYECIVTLLAPC